MTTPPEVLVAHATATGSTAGVAERIAAVLPDHAGSSSVDHCDWPAGARGIAAPVDRSGAERDLRG